MNHWDTYTHNEIKMLKMKAPDEDGLPQASHSPGSCERLVDVATKK